MWTQRKKSLKIEPVKTAISFLILVSFLPLQAFGGCKSMDHSHSQNVKPCHSHQSDQHHHEAHEKTSYQQVRFTQNVSSSESCNLCETGWCKILSLPKRFLSAQNFDGDDSRCGPGLQEVFPFELFLMPNHERAPPIEKPQNYRGFLMSDTSWQSVFSVFII